MSYRDIKNKTTFTLPTISKNIHHDLKLKTRRKAKAHKLSQKQKFNRKTTCWKLYKKHMAGKKSEFEVALDEALIYLEDSNGRTRICYVKRSKQVLEAWVLENEKSFKKDFMVVGILTGIGTVPLTKVASATTINNQYYVHYVLKPLSTQHLPRLYEVDVNKVFFHHHKATSHTANLTMVYLEEVRAKLGITYQEQKDTPAKSLEARSLDFFGFGYLKQRIASRRVKTLGWFWKISQGEWSQINGHIVQTALAG